MTLLRALICATALAGMTACQTYSTKRVVFKNHPIAVYVVNKVVDEETIEYGAKFRNVGREILSFDYTLADEPGVAHVDGEGPNSGLVENLYPGAEVEVKNPLNRLAIHATLGVVTYGKKTKDELNAIYHADKTGQSAVDGLPPVPAPLLPQ